METQMQSVFDAALSLSHSERYALAELLYSSLADEAEPLAQEQRAMIESRIKDVEERGKKTLTLEEVNAHLREKGSLWS